jgi:hypothetical protein
LFYLNFKEEEWSEDLDVLISHPDLDSAEKKKKSGELLKNFVQALETANLIIETISIGDTRFTVRFKHLLFFCFSD